MIGRICIKAAVIATFALASPLIRPAAAFDVFVCVVQLNVTDETKTVHCSTGVDSNICNQLSGLDCVSTLIDKGFSANGAPYPVPLREGHDVPGLPSPGIAEVDGKTNLFFTLYSCPTCAIPVPEPPDPGPPEPTD